MVSNFWVCGQNVVVWPLKLYLSASTVTWHYLFFQHLQNGIWKFCRTLILTTSGSETVKEHWSRVGNNVGDVTHSLLEITRDKTRQERNPRTSYPFLVISAVWQNHLRPLSLISFFHTFLAWLLKRNPSKGIPASLRRSWWHVSSSVDSLAYKLLIPWLCFTVKTNSHQHLLWLRWSWRWWYISLRTAQANWWVWTSEQTVLCHIMATFIRYRTIFDRLKNLTRHFVHTEPFNIFDLFRRKFGRLGV